MGHLINPICLRLGKFINWEFDVFFKMNMYQEGFYLILTVYKFLDLFVNNTILKLPGYLLSHIDMVKVGKFIYGSIFIYNGEFEKLIDNYILGNRNLYKFIRGKKNQFLAYRFRPYLSILLTFNLFFKMIKLNKYYYSLIFLFRKNKWKVIWYILKRLKSVSYRQKRTFFIFLILFKRVWYSLKKLKRLNLMIVKVCKRFIYYYFFFEFFYHFFHQISLYIIEMVKIYFNLLWFKPKIYLLENKLLTAKFLSNFIAMKLTLGFSVKQLMYPIIKEMKKWSYPNLIENKNQHKVKKKNNLNLIKNIKKKYGNFYFSVFNWMFLLGDIFNFEFKNLKKLKRIKWIKFCFFNSFFKQLKNFYFFEKMDKFGYVIEETLIDMYFNLNMFLELKIKPKYVKIIKKERAFISKYNRTSQFKNKFLGRSILGFKFQFLGRFSRKQRAASIIFVVGKMPLNTIKHRIEFSNSTVSLKNSLVNIKTWIFRNDCFSQAYNLNKWSLKII